MYFTLNIHVEVEARRAQPLARHAGAAVLAKQNLDPVQRAEKLELVTESTREALKTLVSESILQLDGLGTEVHALVVQVVDVEGGLLPSRRND